MFIRRKITTTQLLKDDNSNKENLLFSSVSELFLHRQKNLHLKFIIIIQNYH